MTHSDFPESRTEAVGRMSGGLSVGLGGGVGGGLSAVWFMVDGGGSEVSIVARVWQAAL